MSDVLLNISCLRTLCEYPRNEISLSNSNKIIVQQYPYLTRLHYVHEKEIRLTRLRGFEIQEKCLQSAIQLIVTCVMFYRRDIKQETRMVIHIVLLIEKDQPSYRYCRLIEQIQDLD